MRIAKVSIKKVASDLPEHLREYWFNRGKDDAEKDLKALFKNRGGTIIASEPGNPEWGDDAEQEQLIGEAYLEGYAVGNPEEADNIKNSKEYQQGFEIGKLDHDDEKMKFHRDEDGEIFRVSRLSDKRIDPSETEYAYALGYCDAWEESENKREKKFSMKKQNATEKMISLANKLDKKSQYMTDEPETEITDHNSKFRLDHGGDGPITAFVLIMRAMRQAKNANPEDLGNDLYSTLVAHGFLKDE